MGKLKANHKEQIQTTRDVGKGVKEWRPRLAKYELQFLIEVLKDREIMFKELYAMQIRTVVLAATENNRWETLRHNWSDSVFHNFNLHGKRALLFFRAGHGWRNRALDKGLRANKASLDYLDQQILASKGLRHRLEKLLNGKRKGRLDIHSDIARDILSLKVG